LPFFNGRGVRALWGNGVFGALWGAFSPKLK